MSVRSFGKLWIAAAVALSAGYPVAAASRRFTTTDGVSVAYPGGWRRHGTDRDRLLVLSPGPGAEGVVIARGQAMVNVMTVPDVPPGADLENVIARETGDAKVLARRQITLGGRAKACSHLSEVDTSDDVGPATAQLTDSFYCQAGRRLLVVSLTRWPGDPHALRYRRAALDMAASIRRTPH